MDGVFGCRYGYKNNLNGGFTDFKFLTNVQNQSEDQQSQLDAMQQEIAELKAMLVQFLAKLPT